MKCTCCGRWLNPAGQCPDGCELIRVHDYSYCKVCEPEQYRMAVYVGGEPMKESQVKGRVTACSRCGAEVPDATLVCPNCNASMIAVIDVPASQGFTPFTEEIAKYGSAKRAEQDLKMFKSPEHWPHRMLPVKLPRENNRSAVWDGQKLYVDTIIFIALFEGLDPSKAVDITPEEMVGAGWTTD